MKKKLIFGVCSISALLLGALTVDRVLIAPKTVSSFSEVYEHYLTTRESLPPLPFPVAEVMQSMAKGDFSFLKKDWQLRASGGTLYLAEDCKLAKTLKLPLHLMVYEDLQRGEIVILSSADGERYKGEALFDAPEFFFVDEASSLVGISEKRTSEEKAIDFFWDIGPRRVVLDVVLKSEKDAWADLLKVEQASRLQSLQSEIVNSQSSMSMSVPPEHTNDLYLGIDQKIVTVFVPENFTNRVELYSTEDLVSNVWNIAVQNLTPVFTNPVEWTSSLSGTSQFFRAGNMDIDSDSDALPDAREMFVHKTDPTDADTDGDGMPDGWEFQYGLNPLLSSDGAGDLDLDGVINVDEYLNGTDPVSNVDSDGDGMPDDWEVQYGFDVTNAVDSARDADNDGFINLYEYVHGTAPVNSNDVPAASRYISLSGSHTPPFASWETASTNIQAALDAVVEPYEIIMLADGTYPEFMNQVFVFPTNPVMLTGVSDASHCILDGNMFEGDIISGVDVGPLSPSNGWTVLQNITFKRARREGGLFIFDNALVLMDRCVLLENFGGEASAEIVVKNNATLMLKNTQVNTLTSFMSVRSSSDVMLERCQIVYGDVGITVHGDCSLTGRATTIQCWERHRDWSEGIIAYGNAKIEGMVVQGAESGIRCGFFSTPEIKNCALVDNLKAVELWVGATAVLNGCTLVNNESGFKGLWDEPGYTQTVEVVNSILWGNGTVLEETSGIIESDITHSCLSTNWMGEGNVFTDPLIEYDYHIASNSPCSHAGISNALLVMDVDGDARTGVPSMGADEYVDGDGDCLRDWAEVNIYKSNPNDTDTDDDGLSDGVEVHVHGTNPIFSDTDNDGLSDPEELFTHGTDPLRADTDSDGLVDGDEVEHETDPFDSDSDGDGLLDGWEVDYGLDPNDSSGDNGASGDSDGDGMDNTEERGAGTNPTSNDTDSDGLIDPYDLYPTTTNYPVLGEPIFSLCSTYSRRSWSLTTSGFDIRTEEGRGCYERIVVNWATPFWYPNASYKPVTIGAGMAYKIYPDVEHWYSNGPMIPAEILENYLQCRITPSGAPAILIMTKDSLKAGLQTTKTQGNGM